MAAKVSSDCQNEGVSQADFNRWIERSAVRINNRTDELFNRALEVHAGVRVLGVLFEVIEESADLVKFARQAQECDEERRLKVIESVRNEKMRRVAKAVNKAIRFTQGDIRRFDTFVQRYSVVRVEEKGVKRALSRQDLRAARTQLVQFCKETANLTKLMS